MTRKKDISPEDEADMAVEDYSSAAKQSAARETSVRAPKDPYESIDVQWALIEPAYGKEAVPEFYKKLQRLKGKPVPLLDDNGKPVVDEHGRQKYAVETETIFDEMSYLTRDIRGGNLSLINNDLAYCNHYLTLAGDCLSLGLPESFQASYRRVAERNELSLSKGGFWRKNYNTVRSEKLEKYMDENKKKGIFGGLRDN